MARASLKLRLQEERERFRQQMSGKDARGVWARFPGRIAAVLAGGGARGAYEAGVLLAFQDAELPTHLITATSVGSINAASYAGHSSSLVGNAEILAEAWTELTPPAVGIEWTRYFFMLAGLVAATAGFGNLLRHWLGERVGFVLEFRDPAWTWFLLGVVGTVVLLFYDRLPYLGYVVANVLRGRRWRPDRGKMMVSLGANLVVWGFLALVFQMSGLAALFTETLPAHPRETAVVVAVLLGLGVSGYLFRVRLNRWGHWLLRLPLRSGLFPNFERSRFLRQRISRERLRASPIRVVIATTDLERGRARFFSNASRETLAADPGADPGFIAQEVEPAEDLLRAVVASSALPITYEPMPLGGKLYLDGGVVANQPIRPAIRLGADVLFLVLLRPEEEELEEVKTFVDVGLRALEILMLQNLLADLKNLHRVNRLCEKYAAELGVPPEEVVVETGTQTYRYLKAFTVRPERSLGASLLDFGGKTTAAMVLEGYRDTTRVLEEFLGYAAGLPTLRPRYRLRLRPEPLAAKPA